MSRVTQFMPPPGAIVSDDGRALTLDWMLKDPTFIQGGINRGVENKFLSDYIFRPGSAASGSLVYERVLGVSEKYPIRGGVEIVTPGDEFPNVDIGDTRKETAIVDKFGARSEITYENIRWNRTDKATEAITKIANAIVLKSDERALAVLEADTDKLTASAGKLWDAAGTDPFADLVDALAVAEDTELGYMLDTVLINPRDAAKLLKNRDLRDQLPRESRADNPLLSGRLTGFAGLNWIQTSRKKAGSLYILQKNITGVHAEESALYTRRIDKPENEKWIVQSARVAVPVITDPKSIIELTGI